MKIKIAFIDLDGTLLKGQSQSMFIKFLKEKKKIGFFQASIILLWFTLYKINLVKKTDNILSFALSCFKNKPLEQVNSVADEFLSKKIRPNYYKGSGQLINELKSKGIEIVLLSTAVDIIVREIAKDLNIEKFISTKVTTVDGLFTGQIEGMHVYGPKKLHKIIEYIDREKIIMQDVMVIADNYSDEEILLNAGIGIVANPNKKMLSWALQKKLRVLYLDKYEPIQYI